MLYAEGKKIQKSIIILINIGITLLSHLATKINILRNFFLEIKKKIVSSRKGPNHRMILFFLSKNRWYRINGAVPIILEQICGLDEI